MKYTAYILVALLAASLCIKQIGEPDVFWQVRTGQYIIEHLEVPDVDVFSYTYAGDPWTNVKWGTEVIMAFATDLLGMEALMLLNFLVILKILAFQYKLNLKFAEHFDLDKAKMKVAFLFTSNLFLVFMSYRINGRPEMVSHIFTMIYLYLFLDYIFKPGWRIALLIPAQLFWANMHEAYGVGMVMILIFFGAIFFERNLPGAAPKFHRERNNLPFIISGIIALLMPMIHPMGPKMILYPFNIYGQLGENQFTTENFGFRAAEFWQLPAFMFIVVGVLAIFSMRKKWTDSKTKGWKLSIEEFGLPYILIVMAFFVLGLQAFRNMPYFFLAVFPLITMFFYKQLKNLNTARIAIIVVSLLLMTYIGSGTFYKHFFEREKYGLRINPERTPIGAAKFLKENNISGNGYVDYLSSSYLLWYLGDEFKSYIDLRDLDVFEQKFMENVLLSYQYPNAPVQGGKRLFQLMDDADHFEYAVLVNKKELSPILNYLQKRDDFVLCYADPVASVFLRRADQNSGLISQFDSLKPEEIFGKYKQAQTPKWALASSKILWPFYTETDFSQVSVERERFIYARMLK